MTVESSFKKVWHILWATVDLYKVPSNLISNVDFRKYSKNLRLYGNKEKKKWKNAHYLPGRWRWKVKSSSQSFFKFSKNSLHACLGVKLFKNNEFTSFLTSSESILKLNASRELIGWLGLSSSTMLQVKPLVATFRTLNVTWNRQLVFLNCLKEFRSRTVLVSLLP